MPDALHRCFSLFEWHPSCRSWVNQLQQLLNAHDGTDQGHQELVLNRSKHVDRLAARVGIADFHHHTIPEIAAFVEDEDELGPIHALQMLRDGVARLVGGHGLRRPPRAWQGPLTADASHLEGVSELDHLLVEPETATDADRLHMRNSSHSCALSL